MAINPYMKYLYMFLLAGFFGCSKGNSPGPSKNWEVKYEVSSTNTSSTAAIVWTDATGTIQVIGTSTPYTTLPWSYTASISKDASITVKALRMAVPDVKNFNSTDKFMERIIVDGSVVAFSEYHSDMINYTLQ